MCTFQGLDPSEGRPNFWNTLFLIRVDVAYLESELAALSTDQLYILKVGARQAANHVLSHILECHCILLLYQ